MDLSAVPVTSYQRPIATMGLSRTASETNGDDSRKSQFFPPPRIPRPRCVGSLGTG